jgi:ATP-dependent DNA helicase RecQ
MLDYQTTTECRMEFLRRALDDPDAAPCGRCDNCTGTRIEPTTSPVAQDAARAHLGRAGVTVAPRRQWPTALAEASGRIPAGEVAAPGRVLARLSDLGWSDRLRPLIGPDAADREIPDDLLRAAVTVLSDWSKGSDRWVERPVGIVHVASRRRPQLVGSFAARIAEIGRMPVLGTIPVSSGTDGGRANSAFRVRTLLAGLRIDPDTAAQVAGAGGPILLLDDYIDTGWTMAIAARLLRSAGAPAVLPFALAQVA